MENLIKNSNINKLEMFENTMFCNNFIFENCRIMDKEIKGKIFNNCKFINCVFVVELEDIDFKDCKFKECSFEKNIILSKFDVCNFNNCKFEMLKMSAYADCCEFKNCIFLEIWFRNVIFQWAEFVDCEIMESNIDDIITVECEIDNLKIENAYTIRGKKDVFFEDRNNFTYENTEYNIFIG